MTQVIKRLTLGLLWEHN